MEKLLKSACQGDTDSLAAIYEQTNRKAYYLALQLLKNEDTAWDVLQDSYVKAFENLEQLKDANKFQGWIDTIVINKSKDYLKKKKPILFSQLGTDNQLEDEPQFENENKEFVPEDVIDYKETKRLIEKIIDELPEEQRISIILHYMEELPVKQIATIMECSEGTVKSRLNYGRKQIKVKVLDLEKKGTKLYCQPLVPFLYWMFREQIKAYLLPSILVEGAAAMLTQEVVTGTVVEGVATKTAAKVATKAVTKAVRMKVIAAATAVVVGTGVFTAVAYSNKAEEIVEITVATVETTQTQPVQIEETTTLAESVEETTEEESQYGWIQDDYGWRYIYEDEPGIFVTNDWIWAMDYDSNDGRIYYVGADGYRVTGTWMEIEGYIEPFDEDGVYLGDGWEVNPYMIYNSEEIGTN